ncbi:MAG: alpha/beta hydrolase, partial [Clostridia bacterium]|nr:alpha/beta hydrolase [Clostridia bacterium]
TDMKLPANILYPFAKLGAKIFGKFDPDERSPIDAMTRCRLPIIFFHGDADGFVPCSMSKENYEACASEHKRLVIIPDADHGLCFPVAQDRYLSELCDFFGPHGF